MIYSIKKIVILSLILTSVVSQSQTRFETGTWDEIKQKATKENKLIFVDLYFTGCAPCAQMDAEVFPNTFVSTFLSENYIAFKSDIFKEEIGKKLSLKYGVTGFPTFLFLTANGAVLDISSGFHNVDEFTALLSSIKNKANNKQYKKYSTNLDGDYPKFYRDAYLKSKRSIAYETIDAFLKKQENLGDEIPFVVITGLRASGKYADYILDNAEQLAKDYSSMQVRNSLLTIVNQKATTLGKANDETAFNKVLEKAKPIFTKKEWGRFGELFQENFNKNKEQ
ncbi:thioredoxin family protein [Snuella sedimenti]|uniref:Thioredoxin family protein n=1 Tax=Snuella sedimenti TaxID=2798802 RepID=A0A8J7LNU2_9FLAO|nr:thioredoxin family protein [Snuella sedimenti]MBJ6368383.1 thioredoxin family protein [Snuella sedimenti]